MNILSFPVCHETEHKKRKDGAPSVGMVHAKIVKGGPPAPFAAFAQSLP